MFQRIASWGTVKTEDTPLHTQHNTRNKFERELCESNYSKNEENILKRHTFLIVHKDIHREHLTKVNENTEYVLSTIRNAHPQKIQTYR